ncbi:iron-containing alcohol dehydrogenase [Variovorax sp. J22R133]|uniref:iron-containing alcohol dehydrogenase n=1 Tax=Variovorax brevis TaxID=3053503 RepID=UPI002577CDC7|nr:iron-containing alcohol dehydrogenase [Variovorax sp. J22R133]MDM0111405.1 iron-containing alcohol dehydrogenase [Variovorax sp. J22R133]
MHTTGTHLFPAMDRVIFGKPMAEAVADEAKRLGKKRVFLIVSRTLNTQTDAIAKLRDALGDRFGGLYDGVPQHTSREVVATATRAALDAQADLLVAVGGGSVVDAAKMISVCMEHKLTDPRLEGLDAFETKPGPDGRPIRAEFRGPSVRMIAVPSTLSGGEYNAGCLVTDTHRKLKQTFFHPLMMPLAIVLDPQLALHAPETLWVGSGTRAMDHAIEALCSRMGNPLVDAVVLDGIRRMVDALPRSRANPGDVEARRDCQIASWLCSYGLQSRVPMGASHAIGHVLGGSCDVPHYLCTPVMMPGILQFNQSASEEAQRLLAAALGHPGKSASEAFRAFAQSLGLPTGLAGVGVGRDQFDLISQNTMTEFFIFSNPRKVRTPQEVLEILELAAQ